MAHDFKAGQLYRSDGPGEWAVETMFEGPAVIGEDRPERTTEGFVLLRNQQLGYRRVLRVDGYLANQLTRI